MSNTLEFVDEGFINFRQVDNRFALSGGWLNIEDQARWLHENGFVAVLDLQFAPVVESKAEAKYFSYSKWTNDFINAVDGALSEFGIEYHQIFMNDGYNKNINAIYQESMDTLNSWVDELPEGKILVKCAAGYSRSVSTLAQWYCENENLSGRAAINKIVMAGGEIGISFELESRLVSKFPNKIITATKNRRSGKWVC